MLPVGEFFAEHPSAVQPIAHSRWKSDRTYPKIRRCDMVLRRARQLSVIVPVLETEEISSCNWDARCPWPTSAPVPPWCATVHRPPRSSAMLTWSHPITCSGPTRAPTTASAQDKEWYRQVVDQTI